MPDVPDLSTLGQPAETGPPCSKCGQPMPPLTPELASLARQLGTGVVLAHEVCPGGEQRAPEGRYFEVRVQIVEVTETPGTAHYGSRDDDLGVEDIAGRVPRTSDPVVRVEEMISFVAGHRAPNLDAAMRPLAIALGEKWEKAEKQAGVADS